MNEKIADAIGQQRLDGPIDRVALADAAQVQPYAGTLKANRFPLFVQFDPLASHAGPRLGNLLGRRDRAGPASKAPCLPQRRGGEIVGPAAVAPYPHRQLQQGEQPRLDLHRSLGGHGIDERDFALRLEERQLPFDRLDEIEGLQGGGRRFAGDRDGQANLELARHRLARELEHHLYL